MSMNAPERTEQYTERGLSSALFLSAVLGLAVITASFFIPTNDDAGGAAGTVPTRPSVEAHRAVLERCNDRETWVPGHVRGGNGTLWDTFIRVQATHAEARYCEQWLGGRLLVQLLGLGDP
jgi:hypothetical protein